VAQLRKLSEHCEFGETLEDILHDRLVCGCRDQRFQFKLLAEPDLNFKKAFKIAKAMETAEREAKDLHETPAAPVNSMKGTPAGKNFSRQAANHLQWRATPTDCYCCGAKHKATDCRFKDAECNFCKKKGHIAKVCHSKLKIQKSETHQMHTDNDCEPQEYSLSHTQGSSCSSPIFITVKLNGVDLTMELDTGATLSLISERTYKDLFPTEIAPCLQTSKAQLKTYTGEAIKLLGNIVVDVTYNRQKSTHYPKLKTCLLHYQEENYSLKLIWPVPTNKSSWMSSQKSTQQ